MGLLAPNNIITPARANEGRVVKGVRITNTGNPIASGIAGTETDIAKWALTGLALTTGRRYLYRALLTYTKTVAGDTFELRLRTNTALTGTQIGITPVPFGAGETAGWVMYEQLLAGDASWTSLRLSVIRTAGSGTLAYYGASGATNRGFAALYDAGDTGNWTDVP